MSGQQPRYAVGPTVLYVLGFIMCGIVVVKASIIGFYDSDLAWMATVAVAGLASLGIAKLWAARI